MKKERVVTRKPRKRAGALLALFAALAVFLGGAGMPVAQAAGRTVVVTGAYGGCPAKLWSDGVLEFTGSVINTDVGGRWTGDIAYAAGLLSESIVRGLLQLSRGRLWHLDHSPTCSATRTIW